MTELDAFETRFAAAYRRYLDEVPTEVDAAALAHAVADGHPRHGRLGRWFGWGGQPLLRPARLLVLIALVVALIGGLVWVGTRRSEPRPQLLPQAAALVPTGIDLLAPEVGSYSGMVVDGRGILWAPEEGGRLLRVDPATGAARTWTVSDDAAFAGEGLAPARAGGVWLIRERTLRRFDGERFPDVIEGPAEMTVATEAPDGTLWAATKDGAVLHWDGSSWTSLDPGRSNPDATINAIAVDTGGQTWIGWLQNPTPPGTGWVSRYDGSRWTAFDATDSAPLGGGVWSLAQLPDGAVWVGTESGLARFDGSSWTDVADVLTTSVAAGPDGTIWAAAGALSNGAVTVRRFDGRSWTTYSAADGLPSENSHVALSVVPTAYGAYLATGAGIFRLSEGRWERAWPTTPAPMIQTTLLAVSRDDLWAAGQAGIWHLLNGAWTQELIDLGHPDGLVKDMALAPNGTVWAAGSDGVAYRRDGRWVIVDPVPTSAIVVGGNGTAWVGDDAVWQPSGCLIRALRPDGATWVSERIAGCPLPSYSLPVRSLAIDANGALWAGINRGYEPGGLARYDGRNWEAIGEIAGLPIDGATVLGTTSTGVTWVAVHPSSDVPQVRAAAFDGTGWTVVDMPDGFWVGPVLAPDGSLWASTDRGPARYDGHGWALPYAAASTWMGVDAIAPDGTVFGWMGTSLLRFPAGVPLP